MAKAILGLINPFNYTNAFTSVAWERGLVQDGGTFWTSANPTRLTIPAGVSQVEIFAFLRYDQRTAPNNYSLFAQLLKNGTSVGVVQQEYQDTYGELGITFGVFNVTAGDYFELQIKNDFTGTLAVGPEHCFLSAATIDRIGLSEGVLASNLALAANTATIIPYSSAPLNHLSNFNGTNGFTAPAGSAYASLSLLGQLTGSVANIAWEVLRNGQSILTYVNHKDTYGGTPVTTGLFRVYQGDLIQLRATAPAAATIDYTTFACSIEWFSPDAVTYYPENVYDQRALLVLGTPNNGIRVTDQRALAIIVP